MKKSKFSILEKKQLMEKRDEVMTIPNFKFDLFETVVIVDYIENKKGIVSRRLYDVDNNKYIYDVLYEL